MLELFKETLVEFGKALGIAFLVTSLVGGIFALGRYSMEVEVEQDKELQTLKRELGSCSR